MTDLVDILSEMPHDKQIGLFANLAHELASPLTRIMGFTELILMNESFTSATKSYFIDIKYHASLLDEKFRKLSQQTPRKFKESVAEMSDLLTYLPPLEKEHNFSNPKSKSYQTKINVSLRQLHYAFHELLSIGDAETFHFERYLKLYSTLNEEVLENKNIKFYTQLGTPNLETKASYNLELNNLIGNAIKHADPNFIRVSIKTNYFPYLMRVHDDGKGIDAEKIYRAALEKDIMDPSTTLSKQEKMNLIFEREITTSGSQSPELIYGTSQGLGLSMVKKSIEKKGGELRVKSEPGDTRFYFTIPEYQIVK